jgi:hypothetical protein
MEPFDGFSLSVGPRHSTRAQRASAFFVGDDATPIAVYPIEQ